MKFEVLKEFLDLKVEQYQTLKFIDNDPIQVAHQYTAKEDIEISGFLTSIISWGNRTSIIKNARKIMELMENAPFDFIHNHQPKDLKVFNGFVHRTFNADDLKYFIKALQNIYQNYGGLEKILFDYSSKTYLQKALHHFKKVFFELAHPKRTEKHLADPLKGSAAKRMNMYLRWMVRTDNKGVDFGLWKSISPAHLSCPLDVHSGNTARKLGLLTRKQNDAKAVEELDANLRLLDPQDPVKYDFALFGLSIFENF